MVNLRCYTIEYISVRRLPATPDTIYCMSKSAEQAYSTYSAVKQKQINIYGMYKN